MTTNINLAAAHAARNAASTKLTELRADLERVAQTRIDRQARVAHLEGAERAWIDRAASRLVAGDESRLVADAKVQQQLASARADAAAAGAVQRSVPGDIEDPQSRLNEKSWATGPPVRRFREQRTDSLSTSPDRPPLGRNEASRWSSQRDGCQPARLRTSYRHPKCEPLSR